MHPILADFGWHELPLIGRTHLYIGTYGVLFASAALIGWLLWIRIAKRDGLDVDRIMDLGFYALLVGLLGSKVGLILTEPSYYLSSLAALSTTLRAAGVLLFGVLAGIVTIVWYSRRHGIPVWAVLDSAAPSLAIAQAVGRLGCFAAGCCYGRRAVNLPWGVRFTDPAAEMLSGTPLYDPSDPERALNILHPTQLYQAAADFGLFLFLLWIARRKGFTGRRALLFIAIYSVTRGAIEFLRGDAERGVFSIPGTSLSLSTSQIICLAGMVFVAIAWPRMKKRGIVPLPPVAAPATPSGAATAGPRSRR
jgi:phosphatidylglycerol:prolipoprotein diacylglycerol transferase